MSNNYKSISEKLETASLARNVFIGILICGTIIEFPGAIISGLLGATYSCGAVLQNLNKLKDCEEFIELNSYYEYIKRQIILSINRLDLNTATKIFAYLSYLNKEGYLDYKQGTEQTPKDFIRKREKIQVELALNNHEGSKSKSLLLADILNSSSINATTLDGCLSDSDAFKNFESAIDFSSLEVEEIIKYLDLEETKDIVYLTQRIFEYMTAHKMLPVKDIITPKDINHTITAAYDKNHVYYYNITNDELFYQSKENPNILISDSYSVFKTNKALRIKTVKALGLRKNTSLEYEQDDKNKIISEFEETKQKISENKTEVEDLYDSIIPVLKKADKVYKKILKSW